MRLLQVLGAALWLPGCAWISASEDSGRMSELFGGEEGCTGQVWFADVDGDGFGDPATELGGCDIPADYVADGTDCDDTDADVHPGTAEVCDEVDNDCDGDVDEGVLTTWYVDEDGDGYGTPSETTQACERPGGDDPGWSAFDDDCDDADGAVSPGADEVCGDEVDQDCDGIAPPCGTYGSVDTDSAEWTIGERASGESLGYNLKILGDLDGDGWTEVGMGTQEDWGAGEGTVWLLSDPADTGAAWNGAAVDTLAHTWFNRHDESDPQVADGDYLGASIDSGDFDADAGLDLLVAMPYYSDKYTAAGPCGVGRWAAWIVPGPLSDHGAQNPEDVASTLICGPDDASSEWPMAVVLGDIDQDGADEVALQASTLVGEGESRSPDGRLLVYDGVEGGTLGEGDADLTLSGVGAVATVDLNADGVPDLVSRSSYLCSTCAQGVAVLVGPITADASITDDDIEIGLGDDSQQISGRLETAGDVDGDGRADIVITNWNSSPTTDHDGVAAGAGRAFVITEMTAAATLEDAATAIIQGSDIDDLGYSVSAGGDVDGDQVDDLLIGARGAGGTGDSAGPGQAYLFLGPLTGTLDKQDAELIITGPADNMQLGTYVGLGDLDGDGFAEVMATAPNVSAVYVFGGGAP